jgi:tripartite-type tricarboxylate transporter receptor subunit TctC
MVAVPRLFAVLSLSIAFAAAALPAAAQYPAKPIRLIVPFPPSGAAELTARIWAQALGVALGQPVIVEARPGGDGIIAAEAVLKSAADGHTLLYGTATAMSWLPAVRKVPPYDPVTDFTPVSDVGRFGFFLFTHPSVPAKTVAELLDYIRANPGKLNYGTGNSFSIMTTAQLRISQKLDIVHVPYKGDGPLSIDLLGGRVQMAFATPGTALPQVKEGRLRALATMLPNRSPLLPDVPTTAEAGLTGVSIAAWGALFGPGKMPRDVVDRLAREMAVVLKRPEVREGLDRIAFEAQSSSPEELSAFVKEQAGIWRRAVADVGIALE